MDKLTQQFNEAEPVMIETFKAAAAKIDEHINGLRQVLEDVRPEEPLDEVPTDPTQVLALAAQAHLESTLESAISVLERIESYVGE